MSYNNKFTKQCLWVLSNLSLEDEIVISIAAWFFVLLLELPVTKVSLQPPLQSIGYKNRAMWNFWVVSLETKQVPFS
jgi:hypothetical protein